MQCSQPCFQIPSRNEKDVKVTCIVYVLPWLVHLSVSTRNHWRHFFPDISQIPARHYKVFKIVLDILIVLQSLSGQVEQFDDFLLSPPSPPHIGLPLTHSASRNVTILNCIPDYILMSSVFEISPTPSKSHQRAVTDKIQCLLGTKLFTICKMNCKFFDKVHFSKLVLIFMSKF